MRPLLKMLLKEGSASIVILVLVLALIWGVGWYVGRDNPNWMHLPILISLSVVGLWVVMFIASKVVAARSAARIEKQLRAQSGAQLAGADADKRAEIEALRKKFDESLEALKKTKGGKSALFTLPWYIIIGPPGSGKTTALQESGLNFPASQGNAKVRGIGGTRNCDWWFTEDGILLDTAGRYTTVAEDQEEWLAFLQMIKTGRRAKPINGVIVAVSVEDLIKSSQNELDQIAQDVRNRLDELTARLQAVFPVYLMFTKCDLIQGFVEFFEDFTKEERHQVWGFTMPYSVPDKQYTEIFEERCLAMNANLSARQVDLLATERPAQKKQNIFLFPRQFHLARPRMKEFIGAVFGATAYQESAVLRGVYFTSGTQKGTPIDQVLSRMGQAMGLSSGQPGAEDRVEKKSFFIHKLFTRIIFPDKVLARSTSAVLRRQRMARMTVQIASVVMLAVLGWAVVTSFIGNHTIVAGVRDAAVQLDAEAPATNGLDPVLAGGLDRAEELRRLDVLREKLVELDGFRRQGRPLRLGWGMYQGDRMLDSGSRAYFERLMPLLVQPAGHQVDTELRRRLRAVEVGPRSAEYLHLLDLWRAYRMMAGNLPAKADNLENVLRKEGRWISTEDDSVAALAFRQLQFYASQLWRAEQDPENWGWLLVPSDTDLLRQVENQLKRAFWAQSSYDAIVQHVHERVLPPDLAALAGSEHNLLEFRPSQARSTYVNALGAFTQQAWDSRLNALINERARELAAMYRELGLGSSEADIRSELFGMHQQIQAETWLDFLRCIQPNPARFRNIEDSRGPLSVLCSDESPLFNLIDNVWINRALRMSATENVPGAGPQDREKLTEVFKALKAFQGAFDQFAAQSVSGARVSDHRQDPQRLTALAAAFTEAENAIRQAFPSGQAKARQEAEVLRRLLDAAFAPLRAAAKQEVEKLWSETVSGPYRDRMSSKFPFSPQGEESVNMAEFSAMFNYRNGHFWTARGLFNDLAALSFGGRRLIEFTPQFNETVGRAEMLRQAMFHGDNDELANVRFSVTLEQRGLLKSSLITVGTDAQGENQNLRWNDHPLQTRDFVWAQHATAVARMGAMVEIVYGEEREVRLSQGRVEDPWGLLRMTRQPMGELVRAVSLEPTQANPRTEFLCRWVFEAADGGRAFILEATFKAAKEVNPFQAGLFDRFTMAEVVTQ
jgi:type VI secretion system IcmF/VasK family protein